jgi:membrane-associated phospholipid phosphatase
MLRNLALSVVAAALFVAAGSSAFADSSSHKALEAVSGPVTVIYLAAGLGLPLVEDGPKGKDHTLRTVDTLATSLGIAEVTSLLVREKRPNGADRSSFPSDHATAAFAVAAMQSDFHPKQAPYWYAGATAIAASRVGLHVHYIHDVVAGALLGYGTARWELSERHGLILTPLIGRDNGLQLSANF